MSIRRPLVRLVLFILAALASLHSFASADTNRAPLRLIADVDYLIGFLQYQIGGQLTLPDGSVFTVRSPTSQLRFPVNTPAIHVEFDLPLGSLFALQFNFRKNIPYASGKMEDSDWGIWYLDGYTWASEDSLDIFSTSDSTLDLWEGDVAFQFLLRRPTPFMIGARARIEYHYYHFNISDLDQWYPSYDQYSAHMSSSYGQHYYTPGMALTYQVNKVAVNLGAVIGWHWDAFELTLNPGFVAGVILDRDDHLLRKKLSQGTLFFIGVKGDVNATWPVSDTVQLFANLAGEADEGYGTQDQTRYQATSEGPTGPICSIEETWSSYFATVSLGIHFLF